MRDATCNDKKCMKEQSLVKHLKKVPTSFFQSARVFSLTDSMCEKRRGSYQGSSHAQDAVELFSIHQRDQPHGSTAEQFGTGLH